MFNTIKKLLGVSAPEVKVTATDTPAAEKIKAAKSKTKPVTVKPKTTKNENKQTKGTLSKMTKVQIDELAKETFGADLDRRKTKDAMITEFLKLQKKG
jgi:hypothetical protein